MTNASGENVRLGLMLWAAFLSTAPLSNAQNYPSKPVRILVGFAPGGSTALTARLFSQELTRVWGIQVVVDNRPGASGLIAGELTAKAAPDGYTWLVSPQTTTVVAPLILKKVPFDPMKDFAPIAVIGSTPQLLVMHPSLPPRNFREFAAFVKTNARNLSYGSGGIGSTPHMAGGAVQHIAEGAHRARSIQRRKPGSGRSPRRSHSVHVLQFPRGLPACRSRQAARACDHEPAALTACA
jgi:tripartite-type tricarboxylate transporter receptor subunit TctC